jgi:hypothetical protein
MSSIRFRQLKEIYRPVTADVKILTDFRDINGSSRFVVIQGRCHNNYYLLAADAVACDAKRQHTETGRQSSVGVRALLACELGA